MTRSALILFLSVTTLAAQITFEPNLGQAARETKFVARTGNLRLDLASASSRLALRNARGSAHLSLSLAHANPAAKWERLEPLAMRANYFRGASASTWITDVPTFARVREHAVYPGIDLIYYGGQNSLEYDFVVTPGADPHAIRIRYAGADTARIDADGNLILSTPAGEIVQRKPVLYQTSGVRRMPVDGSFLLSKNGEISFAIGTYDRRRELTIDPTISFSSFLGGTGKDQGNAIAVDSSGNTYLVGSTTSGSSDNDVLLRKFSPTGAQIYIADIGGSSDDFGNAIQVDGTGSVYVGGRTSSSDFPLTNAFQPKRAGGADAFLLRVNPAGNSLIFSTYVGGSGDDFCAALAIDRQGAVYATGTTSADFPPSLGSFQTTNRGGLDAFVIKLDAQGNGVYSTLLGGGSDDEGRGIAVDGNGNAYVTGTTLSDSFPQFNTVYQNSRHGGVDAFVTEVNPSGNNLVYSTFLGGLLSDTGYAIAVDSSNFVYVAGKTASRDFPTTSTSYQKDYAGGDNDIFVAKFLPGKADVVYVTYIGSRGSDQGFGLAVDSGGNAYITGDTDSDAFPITSDATQIRRNGNKDAIVAKLNAQGTALLFATYLGGTNDDSGSAIALDSGGNAYVTGSTSSNDFPVLQGAFQPQFGGGGTDAFFAKYQFATVTGPPTISSGGVVNGASFGSGPVAPGSVISIFGTNFIASAVGAPSVPLPTNLGGVSVLVNGVPVPLFYVGPTQINAQVPSGTVPGSATLQVNAPNGTTSQVTFPVGLTAPYLVAAGGRAVITDAAGGLITPSNPAKVGSIVVAYFTGIGPVNAPVTDGAGSPAATSTLPNFATIGGVSAPVAYLGLSPQGVGLGQANLRVPSLATGDYPVVLNIGNVASNSALVAVSQ
ncbi:MAG: SBBP repeat-containing protein [Acidobacteriota bacterium]|nr:SBBP repeat-containing protein [Acidobacteriota bacterium]